jgi:hypothetical protein
MGVDCGGRNRAVTKEDLHNSEVDTAFNEPGRVAVSKAMWRDAGDASFTCRDREGTAERTPSDRPVAGFVGKEPSWVLMGLPELAQLVENWSGQRDDPLFVALADDAQLTIDTIDSANLKGGSFSGPQTAGVDDGAAGFVDRVL